MITKKENATWIPALPTVFGDEDEKHGWLDIDGEMHAIESIHHYDDFGRELLTFTLRNGTEMYSFNDGETFTSDID
jgi:hypothetical protein